jgi:hypothetical protein
MNKFNFTKKNSILMLIAIVFITIGYLILNTGEITLSPIILVISYAVLVPVAIIVGAEKKQK